jgi:SNF2 family DNA or RNA helicase
MLRRTKTTLIDGKPLLNLPSRTVNVLRLDFASNEQKFYNAIEKKMKESAKAIHRSNEAGNNSMNYLSLLLRLRQASCHPSLINSNDVPEPISASTDPSSKSLDMDELSAMVGQISIEKSKCEICRKRFGGVSKFGRLSETERRQCVDCVDILGKSKNEGGLQSNWVSSAKVDAILKKIGEIFAASGDDKVLVFSQWTSFMDILQIALERGKYRYARYDGKVGHSISNS